MSFEQTEQIISIFWIPFPSRSNKPPGVGKMIRADLQEALESHADTSLSQPSCLPSRFLHPGHVPAAVDSLHA